VDLPRAPVAQRLGPEAGAAVVMRLQILVVREVPAALREAEALRRAVAEAAGLQRGGVGERPPKRLALARLHQQPVAVVDGGAEVARGEGSGLGRLRAEEEHAGAGGDAHARQVAPGEEGRADMHHRGLARLDVEEVGAGDVVALQQRVDAQEADARGGALDPEFGEGREFLARRRGGSNGQPAGGNAVALAPPDRAEVAGAQEDAELVEMVGPVQRREQAEAGEAEILALRRRLHPLEAEMGGAVGDGSGLALRHLVQQHLFAEEKAAVVRLELEGQARLAPEGVGGVEADAAVAVIVEIGEALGQVGLARPRRAGGEVARELRHPLGAEGRGGGWVGRRRLRAQDGRGEQRGRAKEKVASQHRLRRSGAWAGSSSASSGSASSG